MNWSSLFLFYTVYFLYGPILKRRRCSQGLFCFLKKILILFLVVLFQFLENQIYVQLRNFLLIFVRLYYCSGKSRKHLTKGSYNQGSSS